MNTLYILISFLCHVRIAKDIFLLCYLIFVRIPDNRIHHVGSEANESLWRLNNLFWGGIDGKVKRIKALYFLRSSRCSPREKTHKLKRFFVCFYAHKRLLDGMEVVF